MGSKGIRGDTQVVFHGIEGRREVFMDGARGNAKLLVRSVTPLRDTLAAWLPARVCAD